MNTNNNNLPTTMASNNNFTPKTAISMLEVLEDINTSCIQLDRVRNTILMNVYPMLFCMHHMSLPLASISSAHQGLPNNHVYIKVFR